MILRRNIQMHDAYSQTTSSLHFSIEGPLKKHIKPLPFKRAFDVFFSLAGLIILFPIFLLIALLIKFTSKGPIIYRQERIGRGGLTFKCLKFRTMRQNAEKQLKKMLLLNPELLQEWTKTRKLKKDPRITKIGAYLRKTSLDELPQLWNVLKGDLSLVGPRPVVKAELIDLYKSKASKILSIRPGMTGLWQVSGRNNLQYEKRVLLDEKYIEEQSLILDIQILLKTIPVIFQGNGAY
jgi:exopolysaccharide production protein ExoY